MKGHMKKNQWIEEVLKAKYESERESSVTVFIRVREKKAIEDLNNHTNLAKALFSKRNQNKGKQR